jgi:hypothetical protein
MLRHARYLLPDLAHVHTTIDHYRSDASCILTSMLLSCFVLNRRSKQGLLTRESLPVGKAPAEGMNLPGPNPEQGSW